jgi:hypothetical protein
MMGWSGGGLGKGGQGISEPIRAADFNKRQGNIIEVYGSSCIDLLQKKAPNFCTPKLFVYLKRFWIITIRFPIQIKNTKTIRRIYFKP